MEAAAVAANKANEEASAIKAAEEAAEAASKAAEEAETAAKNADEEEATIAASKATAAVVAAEEAARKTTEAATARKAAEATVATKATEASAEANQAEMAAKKAAEAANTASKAAEEGAVSAAAIKIAEEAAESARQAAERAADVSRKAAEVAIAANKVAQAVTSETSEKVATAATKAAEAARKAMKEAETAVNKAAEERKKIEDVKREIADMNSNYLNQYFSNNFSLLKYLNDVAESYNIEDQNKIELIFKGSCVTKGYLYRLLTEFNINPTNINNVLDDIKKINAIAVKDVDAYFEIKNYGVYRKLLHDLKFAKQFKFKLKKEGIDFYNNQYANLTIKIKDTLIFDLTLTIKSQNKAKNVDFIPITCGEAKLDFSNDVPTLKILNANEMESFKEFDKACRERKMQLGELTDNMTSCAYRLYKYLVKYNHIIEVTNLSIFIDSLADHYMNSSKENTVYLELYDFIKHKVFHNYANNENKDFIKIFINTMFKVILTYNPTTKGVLESKKFFDEFSNIFIDKLFIQCNNASFDRDRTVFIEQVNLMISLYLEKQCSFADIQKRVAELKTSYRRENNYSNDPYIHNQDDNLQQNQREHYPPANQASYPRLFPPYDPPQNPPTRGQGGRNPVRGQGGRNPVRGQGRRNPVRGRGRGQ